MSEVLIVGAGPGGCSCALWLAQQGIACTVLEQAPAPLHTLRELDLPQSWVLGHPHTSTQALAELYTRHIEAEPLVQLRRHVTLAQVEHLSATRKAFVLSDGTRLESRALVLATGLRTKRLAACADAARAPLDAEQLTQQRNHLKGQRILLLGGGDNAVENALFLAQQGNEVVLWARNPLRAQRHFQAQLQGHARIEQRIGIAMPEPLHAASDGSWHVRSPAFGSERFDQVAVLFGFEPNDSVWQQLQASPAWAASGWPQWSLAQPELAAAQGLFLAGDISQRLHPSIQTALADGVTASKQVYQWLASPLPPRAPWAPARPSEVPTSDTLSKGHTLSLTGLRFAANLGILAHEKTAPQPIQVDAELSLGAQLLTPHDDDIHHVLDYRKVRQIIIDECTAEHVNLLESLIGKLSLRLMQLPGVRGVRVKIAKLEIFDDCEVAIRIETGQW